jgi:hypothetical protein
VEGAFGAFNGLRGTAWKIVSKDRDTYTVTRHDGQFSQTFSRPPAWRTLAVKVKGAGQRPTGRQPETRVSRPHHTPHAV